MHRALDSTDLIEFRREDHRHQSVSDPVWEEGTFHLLDNQINNSSHLSRLFSTLVLVLSLILPVRDLSYMTRHQHLLRT